MAYFRPPPYSTEGENTNSIRCELLLARAENLNFEEGARNTTIKRYNKFYDLRKISDYMSKNEYKIEEDVNDAVINGDIESAISRLSLYIDEMHQTSVKYSRKPVSEHLKYTNDANKLFEDFTQKLKDGNDADKELSLKLYIESRKNVTLQIMLSEQKMWNEMMYDNRTLWSRIDWNGKLGKNDLDVHPTINQLRQHFEEIYESDEKHEREEIEKLSTNVYVPILDDPINKAEIEESLQRCKKGGYDFKNPVMSLFVTKFMYLIVLLFNMMFFIRYPIQLACSLLHSIPKSGNLRLPSNFRGIQMLPSLGVLYDRILNARLSKWVKVQDEQSGFRKGKSTLHQIFTIYLLILLAKSMNITLYIGCFDIAKAFDKVSRLLLLRKLIKQGIGFCMLNALKSIYSFTSCIVTLKGKLSRSFETRCGIRQGASSSAILFISFIDDLVEYLRFMISEPSLIFSGLVDA